MRAKVVVEIRGGTLVGLYSSDPGVETVVVDWDDLQALPGGHSASCPAAPLEAMPRETREQVEGGPPQEVRRSSEGT